MPPSARSGWISPNARCPVCGASVYFYANENGSRVFFDDVGPPWPKHPCTDNGAKATKGSRRAPSRHDFSSARTPGRLRDHRWKPYAVKGAEVKDGYSRITLKPFHGSGAGPAFTVAGRLPLRADDVVFVYGRRMSFFDAVIGAPAVVEDAGRPTRIAPERATGQNMQHAPANPPSELPPTGGLALLAIGFVFMIVAIGTANGLPSVLTMTPGLLLGAAAVYRLNPSVERATRTMLAVLTALVMICPAGVVGGMIQVAFG